MRDIIKNQLREEKDRHYMAITRIVSNNIPFNKEDTYYFKCNGSGYYLKYFGTSGETLIFNIYSKGGKLKTNKFYINWYGMNSIKLYKAG